MKIACGEETKKVAGGSNMFGEKRLNPKQFADSLLSLRNTFEEEFRTLFVNELCFGGDE